MKSLDRARNPLDVPLVIVSGTVVLCLGALMFNLLPLLLGLIADSRALSPEKIGLLATTYVFSFSLVSFPAVFLIKKIGWRGITTACCVAVSLLLIVVVYVESFSAVLTSFFLIGLATGMLFGLGNRILGGTSDPDRTVGYGYVVALVVAAVILFVSSAIVIPKFGAVGVFFTAALFILMLAATSPWLPSDDSAAAVGGQPPRGNFTTEILLGLLSMVCFYIGAAGLWAFIERIGVSNGIAQSTVALILGTGLLVTALASLLPMITEGKVRRSNMLLVLFIVASIALYLFSLSNVLPYYFFSTMLFNFAWGAAVVYISAVIAIADSTGTFLVLIAAATGLGASIGPMLAGYLIEDGDYSKVFVMCAFAIFISIVLARLSEVIQMRRQTREFSMIHDTN